MNECPFCGALPGGPCDAPGFCKLPDSKQRMIKDIQNKWWDRLDNVCEDRTGFTHDYLDFDFSAAYRSGHSPERAFLDYLATTGFDYEAT